VRGSGPLQAPNCGEPAKTFQLCGRIDLPIPPIEDANMPAIVDYLAKTYGNEQPK
jgi:hypothetical protein